MARRNVFLYVSLARDILSRVIKTNGHEGFRRIRNRLSRSSFKQLKQEFEYSSISKLNKTLKFDRVTPGITRIIEYSKQPFPQMHQLLERDSTAPRKRRLTLELINRFGAPAPGPRDNAYQEIAEIHRSRTISHYLLPLPHVTAQKQEF